MSDDRPTQQDRTVIHVDMDAFFARAEKRERPDLAGTPVIVGGTGERGVVSTASYEAREYGVHSAMPMEEARRLCPDATVLSPNGSLYQEISSEVLDVLHSFTPIVQKVSLDEAYLDVSGVLHQYSGTRELAVDIKDRIQNATQLTCSVGVGPNRMVAKLASDRDKPDGLTIVQPDHRKSFMAELKVDDIPGIGPSFQEKLHDRDLTQVSDLQEIDVDQLRKFVGNRAFILKRRAMGVDPSPVQRDEETKSISNEETYSDDLTNTKKLKKQLHELTRKVCRRLRNNGLEARTIFIKIRRGDFTTLNRQTSHPHHIRDTETIWRDVLRLFEQGFDLDERGVRLQGVGVTNLQKYGTQKELFDDSQDKKREQLNDLMDEINDEFGDDVLTHGRDLLQEDDQS